MRLIVNPPMLECPACGCEEFVVSTRVKGIVRERRSMRDGSLSVNTEMWNDIRFGRTSRTARCGDCDAFVGSVVAEADDLRAHEPARKLVRIVTLAVLDGRRILLVGKRGLDQLILPGGKREPGEDDLTALRREIREELGCAIRSRPRFVGVFRDAAGGAPDVDVEVTLYAGSLTSEPRALAEIERLAWCDLEKPGQPVAPSLSNLIMPYLLAVHGDGRP